MFLIKISSCKIYSAICPGRTFVRAAEPNSECPCPFLNRAALMHGPVVPGLLASFNSLMPNVNRLFVFEAKRMPEPLFVKALNKHVR